VNTAKAEALDRLRVRLSAETIDATEINAVFGDLRRMGAVE